LAERGVSGEKRDMAREGWEKGTEDKGREGQRETTAGWRDSKWRIQMRHKGSNDRKGEGVNAV